MANIIKIFKISLPIILFFPSILKANSDSTHKNPFFISVRTYYGFIIPHSESIRSISYSRPRGIGVDVGWLFLNKRAWDYCFCYPMLGFNFYYTDFNNRKILGHAFALLFYAEPSFNFSRNSAA